MNILKYVLFCMLFTTFSCRDNNPPDDTPIPLNGTQWKLAGSVNAETGILKEFEPVACAECFTLMFNTDYKASVRSISSTIAIDLLALRNNPMMTLESETWIENQSLPVDGDHFRKIMVSIESFTTTSKELKLYYNNKTEYLLFKRIQP